VFISVVTFLIIQGKSSHKHTPSFTVKHESQDKANIYLRTPI